MRTIWYEKPGAAADVMTFGEMPDPEPGDGEVRVRVAWSAVNPTDVKRREAGRELARFDRIIPNNDGSGVIDRVGAGVDPARIGEEVWLFGAQAMRPFGTAAEYTLLPSRQAIRLPEAASLEDGACLGVPAVTAHMGLFLDGPIDGKTLLVTGGGGRVGRYAVQMAKRAGATVISTAGSAEKAAHVRDLGADHVFNYREDDIVTAVRDLTGGKGVDRMLDVAFAANIPNGHRLVRPGGMIASYAAGPQPTAEIPFQALMYANIMVRPFSIYGIGAGPQDAAFAGITACLEEGALRHLVGGKLPFDEMIRAHEMIAADEVFGCLLVSAPE